MRTDEAPHQQHLTDAAPPKRALRGIHPTRRARLRRLAAPALTAVATLAIVAVWTGPQASAAVPSAMPSWSLEALLDASFSTSAATPAQIAPTAAEPEPITREIAALIRQGISPTRASEAIGVQSEVTQTNLVSSVEHALGGTYGGAWFEPSAAKLHIGVTSNARRRAVARIVAGAGLGADVVQTPVRSTRAALLAAQRRWDAKLARALPHGGSMTAIDSQRNAVVVKLSSSISMRRRAALERAAARAGVNVLITVVPAAQLLIRPKGTKCEFASTFAEKPRYAWCEKTITSGVTIESSSERCTAGPMLIKGTKTFVLTAGHCVAEGKNEVGEAWESEWPNPAPPRNKDATKKLGKVSAFTYTKALDSAEIEVEQPGEFTAPLPTPVPALMAEWGNWKGYTGKPPEGEPLKPIATAPGLQFESRAVSGESLAIEGYADCHEGKTSGEQCGVVGMERVVPKPSANGVETENLVEDSACAEKGDSGGPYFYYAPGFKILMEGTLVGGPEDVCNNTGTGGEQEGGGKPINYFEPMKTLLGAYKGQRLLTTATELRKVRLKGLGGPLIRKNYTSTSGAGMVETGAGSKLTCAADAGSGEAGTESSGTAKLALKGCEAFGNKCHTPGAAEGEVVLNATYRLAFTNGGKDEVGLLLELIETTIECGKNCEGKAAETLKLRGTAIGAVTPINEQVAPPKKFTIAFSQAKGVQAPTEYEKEEGAKTKAILELAGSGTKAFGFEQAGIADVDELLFEEIAEIEP